MIRWGFLGAGNIASKALAPATHAAAGAVLAAAAARDPLRAAALGPERVHATYQDLLADPDVDAVYISLANDAHAPWSIAAMEAGKHVLCEKPLAMTAAEVRALTKVAESTGRSVVEASWYRWHPRIRLAQQLIASGRIGEVRHVSAAFGFAGDAPDNFRNFPQHGGGALYDVGCYGISATLWAFAGRPVEQVSARCEMGSTGVDLESMVQLSFARGGEAEVACAIAVDLGQRLVITGESGSVKLAKSAFAAWQDEDTDLLVTDDSGTEMIRVPAANAYQLMVEEMSSVLAGGPGWLLPLEESLACAEVIDAALRSGTSDHGAISLR